MAALVLPQPGGPSSITQVPRGFWAMSSSIRLACRWPTRPLSSSGRYFSLSLITYSFTNVVVVTQKSLRCWSIAACRFDPGHDGQAPHPLDNLLDEVCVVDAVFVARRHFAVALILEHRSLVG